MTAPRKPWATSRRTVPTDWKARRRRCLVQHGGICHVCGHGGAGVVDHLLNVARGGTHEPDNLRPVHGTPCPTCGRDCHGDKTKDEARAGMARHGRKRPAEQHPGRLARVGRVPRGHPRQPPTRIAAPSLLAHRLSFLGLG